MENQILQVGKSLKKYEIWKFLVESMDNFSQEWFVVLDWMEICLQENQKIQEIIWNYQALDRASPILETQNVAKYVVELI